MAAAETGGAESARTIFGGESTNTLGPRGRKFYRPVGAHIDPCSCWRYEGSLILGEPRATHGKFASLKIVMSETV